MIKIIKVIFALGLALGVFVGLTTLSDDLPPGVQAIIPHHPKLIVIGVISLGFLVLFLILFFKHRERPVSPLGKDGERIRQEFEVKGLQEIKSEPRPYWKDGLAFLGWCSRKKGAQFEVERGNVYLTPEQRTLHVEVIGATGTGKTQGVILPLIYQDLHNSNSIFCLDGKGEKDFYDKIKFVAEQEGRGENFYYLNPSYPELCAQYNPLQGKNAKQCADLTICAFQFEKLGSAAYYSDIAKTYLSLLFKALCQSQKTFTFKDVLHIAQGKSIAPYRNEQSAEAWDEWASFKSKFRGNEYLDVCLKLERIADLPFLNSEKPDFSMDKIAQGGVLICQLNTGRFPDLAPRIAKALLWDMQLSVAKRHENEELRERFLSIVLDEFQSFLYDGFKGFLAQARSANCGLHFSHQSMGDLSQIRCPDPRAMAQTLRDNSRLKVIFHSDDPDTAEWASELGGTKQIRDTTDQFERGVFGSRGYGKGSERTVDVKIYHPNIFKTLPLGVAFFVSPDLKILIKLPLYKI